MIEQLKFLWKVLRVNTEAERLKVDLAESKRETASAQSLSVLLMKQKDEAIKQRDEAIKLNKLDK